MSFKLGRLAPHPEATHPRVKLAAHLPATAQAPAIVDWHSKVDVWPMLLNDQLGDCTAAGFWHLVQAWTAYASSEYFPTDQDALDLYEPTSGYNPRTGANDNGAVEQDVLQFEVDKGADGHKILAFAQVDHTSADEMKTALSVFGGLYVGIQCPKSMQQQFAAGEVIDYVPGSPVEGGHCVVIAGWDTEYIYIVTWGALVKMTWAFWEQYGDEAWVIVTQDFIEKNSMSPSGLDITGLLSEFREITSTVAPSPHHAAPKPPGPLARVWAFLKWLL